MAEQNDPPAWEASYLGFGRHRQEWEFLVRVFRENEEINDNGFEETRSVLLRETPLRESSRGLRMGAAERIDALLEEILAEAKEKVALLDKAIENAPMPSGWENSLQGLDANRLVHLLKPRADGNTLCGAQVMTTNFERGRPGPKCRALWRDANRATAQRHR